MPQVSSVQPAAVEIYWKYRLESIQSIRLGTKLNKPNMDSDSILAGIQNEGLIDVPFIPSAERIDLYYRSLNEAGRGPVPDIVATTDEFLLNSAIAKRTTDMYMRGAGVLFLRSGDILRVDDELVVVELHVLLDRTKLYEGLNAFWYLSEADGDRSNVYEPSGALKNYTQNPVLSQAGPQAGTNAAYFTGSTINPQALSVKYNERLSLGDTDNNDGFTFSCWARLHDDRVDRVIISRSGGERSGRREFQIQYNSAQNRFEARIIKSDSNVETVYTLTHSEPVSENTWYFFCCWFDPTANRLYLSVNNVPENIVIPAAGAIPHVSIPTTVGAQLIEESDDSAHLVVRSPWNGRIANVGFWKRSLTGAERVSLFRDYTLDSVPAAHVILEDRGAHGTDAAAHDVDATITKMFVTVPHNSIVMDKLADANVPDAPESFFCGPSGDDAEIGVEIVISPPANNRKTIKRIEIQAKTVPIFPSNIQFTTGSKTILSGPHIGEVTQGGTELITSSNLSGVSAPFHLYTYEAINVNTGVIVAPYAYTIEVVEEVAGTGTWRIQIRESFNTNHGIFGNSQDITFLVVRGWLDAPHDYVINDAPIVTPPAGEAIAHVPFQKFYKTTKNVYLRARYINVPGGGPWIYWDGVNGSVDKTQAIVFSPAGLQIPTAIDGTDGTDGASVEFVYRLHDSADPTTFPAIPPTSLADRNTDDYVPPHWHDGAPLRTADLPLVIFGVRTRPRGAGAWGEFRPPRLLTGEQGEPGENALTNLDVVAIVRWWKVTATSSPPIIPQITNEDNLHDVDHPPESFADPDDPGANPGDWTRLTNDEMGPYSHFTTTALPYLWECYRYHIELKGGAGFYAQQFRGPFLVTSDPSLFGGVTPSNVPTAALTASVTSIVSPGGDVTLFWTTTNAVSASISVDPGSDIDIPSAALASGSTSRNITETTTFTLRVVGAAGTTPATDVVVVMVTAQLPNLPVINSFAADDPDIMAGESTTLRWDTTGATSVTLDGDDVSNDGSRVVSPTSDTTYTLVATNDDGSVTRETEVEVSTCPRPTINSFTASPGSIEDGESSTLSWEVTDGDGLAVSINRGIGAVNADGSTSVSPSTTTIYTLTASNDCGSRTAQVTVTVTEPPPPVTIQSFSAAPSTIDEGDSSELSWATTNAAVVSISPGVGNQSADGNVNVSPTQTTEYTLTAYRNADKSGGAADRATATTSVTVTPTPEPVDPPPRITSYTATPPTIDRGETSLLEWTTENAARTTINNLQVSLNGSLSRSPDFTRTYHLDAYEFSNSGNLDPDGNPGRSVRSSLQVTVNQPSLPVINSFNISPRTIVSGESVSIEWETTGATSVALIYGGTSDSVALDGSATRSPTSTTNYTLRATNVAGSVTESIQVTVNAPPPVINSFSASPSFFTVDFGVLQTIVLTWNTTNATSCSINQGIGSVPVDGSTTQDVEFSRTWRLTATNADGVSVTRDTSVTGEE